MKYSGKIIFIALILVFLASIVFPSPTVAGDQSKIDVYLFYGQGCPHCESVKSFLSTFKVRYRQNLEIKEFEVYFDEVGKDLFADMAKAYGIEIEGVPTLFIGEEVIVGANLKKIEQEVTRCLVSKSCISPGGKLIKYRTMSESDKNIDKISKAEGQKNDASNEGGGTVGWIVGGAVLIFIVLGAILFSKRAKT
ncbi:MAG: hypothetical protein COY82_02590 [Parcubacteria group bacterium CG_4_10_14_0_8_um_filter_35_7]|nr:MAG: hypothetical protein COX43_00040 [Parcubacteria group bacterium CG23_combo_of_CG06-09_8_20_14_all_35_9]PIY78421.1 MAG: hypothetical protein COY82_02590 [Parcubacteria group bacterium CG_4_10_14_0_8_um_filter_35_7]